jgi:hypothetical protein
LRNKNIFHLKSNFKRGGFFKTENKKKFSSKNPQQVKVIKLISKKRKTILAFKMLLF